MGNTQTKRGLTRSGSQECLDPRVIEAAMAKAGVSGSRRRKNRKSHSVPRIVVEEADTSEPMLLTQRQRRDITRQESRRRLSVFLEHSQGSSQRMLDSSFGSLNHSSMHGSSHSRRLGLQSSRQMSTKDFANSASNMSPDQVLRQLEEFAEDGDDGYLHSLKELNNEGQ